MSRLTVHYNNSGDKTGFDDFLKVTQPEFVYSLNGNIRNSVNKFSPKTKIIYRRQSAGWQRLPNGFFNDDPVQNAIRWMTVKPKGESTTLIGNWILNEADYYDALNEPSIELPPNPSADQIADMVRKAKYLNTWTITSLEIANQFGLKLSLFSFPFGSPPFQVWEYLLPAMRLGKQYGAILSLHAYTQSGGMLQYNPDSSFTQDTLYWTLRHREVYGKYVPLDAQLPIVYTEASSSNGYDVELSGQAWIDDIGAYDTELFKDSYIAGICGFQLGGNESNLVSILPQYATYIQNHPTTEVPPEEEMLNIVVTENLVPPDTTKSEMDYVVNQTFPVKQDVQWSADTAKHLVKAGLPGSRVIVWSPERWTQGDIIAYLGVPTEIKRFPESNFRLTNPVPSIPFRVTSMFDTPRNYANGKHEGLDLDGYDDATGQTIPVVAGAAGVVATVNNTVSPNSYGKYVVIDHQNGYKTWYCHLSSITVVSGQTVTKGQKVGVTGATGTNAIHLHLNLQHIGQGASGYFVPDVVDPLPYIDYTPVVPPVTGTAWRGLHTRADGMDHNSPLFALEKQVAQVAKCNAIKLMTNSTFESLDAFIAQGIDPKKIVLRLFADMADRVVTPQEFYSWQTGWLAKFASVGGLYTEVANEVNLIQESYGTSWKNGSEFAAWYTQVVDLIKANYPTLKMVYPGLSPQVNVPEFEATLPSLIANGKVDVIGAHSYWVSASDMDSELGGRYYRRFLKYGKPLLITEFANVNSSETDTIKGKQYKSYYASLEQQVLGAYAFVSSASDPVFNTSKQTWIRNNTITDIAYQVGA